MNYSSPNIAVNLWSTIIGCLIFILIAGCENNTGLFKSISSSSSGVTFQNELTESDDFNILDYLYFYNGGGVAIGDIDNDGLPDIYFSGNQVGNKLYRNKGNLAFEDITDQAGVAGSSDWNTGALMGDVNGDGLIDIYVCAVVGIRGKRGHNELFINKGNGTFEEQSAAYGLDFDTYSSSAAFLDYDRDGDLDLYLLNHAIHTQESFGQADLRLKRNYETGDKLLRNDGSKFVDVSEAAGIYGGINGYGLGLAISDFNQDGFPDIYVGNDFHEDDYYYINNGDGTFSERLREYFAFTTRFSMGSDVADINHDGRPDLISLDMLAEDEKVLKSSEGDDDINIQRLRIQRYGYHYQFSRNTLQINRGKAGFEETALMNGVAATDWSWSALFADFNQDGEQDLFISNGIPKRPNDLDYIRFVSNDQIKNTIDATKLVDQRALDLMPSGLVSNYLFAGTQGAGFEDKSSSWLPQEERFSNATAIGDLDNDGDLDIVINNINAPPSIYVNTTDASSGYLKLKFDHPAPNTAGIGTKVFSYHQGQLQFKELYTMRGFQASSEPIIHFGYGATSLIDSLRIVWPSGQSQLLQNVAVNQTLVVRPEATADFELSFSYDESSRMFDRVADGLGFVIGHQEDRYTDFDRQKLIPYQMSDRGPALAKGDLNGDGREDFFIGSSKYESSKVFIQVEDGFQESPIPLINSDSIKEDVAAAIADFNGDGEPDIIVGSGGADFYNKMEPLLDSYYSKGTDGWLKATLPEYFENASIIRPYDYDNDGDMDVFIGNQSVSNDFGKVPTSLLLNSDQGQFIAIENEALQRAGMVTDALWTDYDEDGNIDLILVGEWMTPKFFKYLDGDLIEDRPLDTDLTGLWQTIAPMDIDKDGDMDYVLGNWGLNSKFVASQKWPMKMYYGDLDDNGSTETILAVAKEDKYYPLENFDQLAGQLISLRKKFTTYEAFAGLSVEEAFDPTMLAKAELLEVSTLASGYLKNENGQFSFHAFPRNLQVAPIMALKVHDFDGDGEEEMLAAGNYFGVKPFHGRLGSFSGALIQNETDYVPGYELGLDLMNKSVRHLETIQVGSEDYLIVIVNNDSSQVYKLFNR
ncbi:MAG: VCBS repeat-containing protein [Cyclobacteriaceae bacterium]